MNTILVPLSPRVFFERYWRVPSLNRPELPSLLNSKLEQSTSSQSSIPHLVRPPACQAYPRSFSFSSSPLLSTSPASHLTSSFRFPLSQLPFTICLPVYAFNFFTSYHTFTRGFPPRLAADPQASQFARKNRNRKVGDCCSPEIPILLCIWIEHRTRAARDGKRGQQRWERRDPAKHSAIVTVFMLDSFDSLVVSTSLRLRRLVVFFFLSFLSRAEVVSPLLR